MEQSKGKKKVVIITGANSGLGYHLAFWLLKRGYNVAALDIELENIISLEEAYTASLLCIKCDVTIGNEVKASVETVYAKWNRVDVLVNNACMAIFKYFEDKDIGKTQKEFDVNYFGYIRMIKAVLPYMKEQGGGIIHNTSSGIGITGFEGKYGYASTKAAIETLTRTLAMELEPYGICVNLIQPPLMYTKSAAPLGIPVQMMEIPEKVAERLSQKILSTRPTITYDFKSSLSLFFFRRFPERIGKFLSKMTEKERIKNLNKKC